jgi:hypothetical protein
VTHLPNEPNPNGVVDGNVYSVEAHATNSELAYIRTADDMPGFDVYKSIYCKRGPGHNGTSKTNITFYDGVVGGTVYSDVVGAAWTRIGGTHTQHANATRNQMRFYPDPQTGVNTVYIWGAQCEVGTALTRYVENVGTTQGGVIANWPDQSGNGNDFLSSTQLEKPLVQANMLDGWAAARFDGIDDEAVSAAAAVQPYTAFWVGQRTGGSGNAMIVDSQNGGARAALYYSNPVGTPQRSTLRTWAGGALDGPSAIENSVFHVHEHIVNGVSSKMSVDFGAYSTPGDAGAHDAAALLFGRYVGGGNYWTGHLVELILVPALVGATEYSKLREYFDTRYPSIGI